MVTPVLDESPSWCLYLIEMLAVEEILHHDLEYSASGASRDGFVKAFQAPRML
jgi:hypothetical protein